jgi:hypothetical protein
MTEWSIAVTTRGPGPVDAVEDAAEAIAAKLSDFAPVLAISPDEVTIRIAVEGDPAEAVVPLAISKIRGAVESAGWSGHVIEVEASEWSTFEKKLDEPTYPELVGITEIAALLGTSRQRASELARSPKFPAPLADLAAGPVWPKPAIARFVGDWERRPGRPRSKSL